MTDLEQRFRTYFDEIDRCIAGKCYWALPHLLVVLPAVCAALETPSGEAGDNEYKNWCRRYFDRDPRLTSADRYAMRCALVHQGRTTVTDAGQYGSYTFVQPSAAGDVHLTVRDFGGGHKNLTIDVNRLAGETTRAMRAWFADLPAAKNAARAPNVERHVPSLAREGQAMIPGAAGVIIVAPTTSSTGSIGRV